MQQSYKVLYIFSDKTFSLSTYSLQELWCLKHKDKHMYEMFETIQEVKAFLRNQNIFINPNYYETLGLIAKAQNNLTSEDISKVNFYFL